MTGRRALGFTGTRAGMTPGQAAAFRAIVRRIQPAIFRHGDCTGADAEAHDIVRAECRRCMVILHPCDLPRQRAFRRGDATREPLSPLVRNHEIVDTSDWMIAAPATVEEMLRSGTWSTIRYARKQMSERLTILWPEK